MRRKGRYEMKRKILLKEKGFGAGKRRKGALAERITVDPRLGHAYCAKADVRDVATPPLICSDGRHDPRDLTKI